MGTAVDIGASPTYLDVTSTRKSADDVNESLFTHKDPYSNELRDRFSHIQHVVASISCVRIQNHARRILISHIPPSP